MSRLSAALLTLAIGACAARADSPAAVPADTAKQAAAALQPLLKRLSDTTSNPAQLRLDLLALQRTYPGTEAARKAAVALLDLPSPLDKLDAAKIDANDRIDNQPKTLVAVLRGHTRTVTSLAFAPDGVTLASSSLDGTVRLWKLDGPTGRAWATLQASSSGVAFCPDGKTLATGRGDTRVQLWNLTGKQPREAAALSGHTHRPFVLLYSPNGKMLVSGCFGPVMRLWDLREQEPELWGVLPEEQITAAVSSVAITPDGTLLAAGSPLAGSPLRLWDVGGKFMKELDIPKARARVVALSPDNKTLAFTGDAAEVPCWDVRRTPPKMVRTLAGHPVKGETATVRALAFAPDGKLLATAGKDRRVVLWRTATGQPAHAWTLPDEMHALAFAADGRHLAAAGAGGSVYLFRH